MKIISLASQKGGSGKSTLCASLAVAAQEAGHQVAILEIDKQATISQWANARQGKPPDVAQTTADKLEAIVGRLIGSSGISRSCSTRHRRAATAYGTQPQGCKSWACLRIR